MEDLSDLKVRDYQLLELIGAGGFGAVYRAWQSSVDREVAVKVILPEYADHPDFGSRFEAEAKMVARLEHPYIIPLYEYWRDEDGAYLVMRWLKGGSLRDCIEDEPLDLSHLSRLLEQIGSALAFSHQHSVIHRDLKPENILLDEEENAYLTDFGIAKDLSGPGVTESGKIMGSVDYLSPEQAKGEEITPQTDIYALGLVLYELLTCEHPFPDQTPIQMIQKQLNEPLPPVTEKRPDLPTWIDEIIYRATAKAPEYRYPDVEALLTDFREAMTAAGERALTPELPAFLTEERPPIEREVFVARERELAWLHDALGQAVAGQGKVVFITGNAGRGKTALLSAFMRRAEEDVPDLLVASGTCNMHSGVGDPYLPFRQILEVLTGDVEQGLRAGTITTEQAQRQWTNLRHAGSELVENATDLINRLVPGPALAGRAMTAGCAGQAWWNRLNQLAQQDRAASGDLEQAFLFEQCARYLRSLSQETPLLLVLDDLQWADAASIGLLFHMGRAITSSRILLVGAYRPDEVATGRVSSTTGQMERHPMESVVNELTRIYGETILDLGHRDEVQGRAFVDAFIDTEPNRLDDNFRQALYEHAEGHPLFTIELLRAMQDRGELVQDSKGDWMLGESIEWISLPPRVEAVIAERIGYLDREMRRMLSVASVEGEEFTAQIIARIEETPEAHVLRELSEQAEKKHRLVMEHGEVRVGSLMLSRYRFAHQLLHRYLYKGLATGERRLLHLQIAQVIEELYGDETEQASVALAFHYREAGDDAKALPYLAQAGDHSRDQYANEDAEGYYRAALDTAKGSSQRAVLLKELGRVQVRLANPEGLDSWREAITLYKSLDEWSEVAWLYARSARSTAHLNYDEQAALKICLEGLVTVPTDLESSEMAALLHEAGRTFWFTGQAKEALEYCEKALWMAERLQAVDVRADTLATRGLLPDQDPGVMVKDLEEAVELSESAGLIRIASRAHHNLGYLLSDADSISHGRHHVWQAAELERSRGNLYGQNFSLANYAWYSMWMGKLDDADRIIAEREKIQKQTGIPEIRDARLRADRMVLAGQLGEAITSLQKARPYYQERSELQQEEDTLVILANAYIELGQFDKAIESLESAIPLSDALVRVRRIISRAMLSRAYSQVGDAKRAQVISGQAHEIAGTQLFKTERAEISWTEAHIASVFGDWPSAIESYQTAASVFDQLENRWNQSRVIRDWAAMHAARGHDGDVDEARRLFEKALAMYEEMGMLYYAEMVTERLQSLGED